MSQENVEIVRLPMAVSAHSRRRFVERLIVRFPGLTAYVVRRVLQLPPNSRLRQRLVRRVMRQGTEAINRGDYEVPFVGFYAADCELVPPPKMVGLGQEPAHGREGRIRFQERWTAEWGEFRFEPDEVIDFGDGRRVMMIGRMRGSGLSSGATFDDQWGVLFTLSGGRVIREEVFFDHADALEAAGLSE
jgi:ketosteroid isomerase-like protein